MKKINRLSKKIKEKVLDKQGGKCTLDNEKTHMDNFSFFLIDKSKSKEVNNICALCHYCTDNLKCQE